MDDVEVVGFFEADLDAGLWVDVHHGRTRPMTPEEIDEARQASEAGSAILILGPLPGRDRKLIYGVRAVDI
ncbi:hypothetical protein Q0M94_28000 (plasmid) [Deinococcus radiomollis]|uniref:hypothetical protein n=1 Tax=Deinococcus radiomollis TaxID=468916 RepID=UPI0038922FBA